MTFDGRIRYNIAIKRRQRRVCFGERILAVSMLISQKTKGYTLLSLVYNPTTMGDSKTNGKMKRRRPMKKKFLALVLTLAMVLSLVPVTALATDGPSGTAPDDVVYGHYTNTGEWKSDKPENAIPGSLKDTVTTVDKTAKKVAGQDNQYEVTLKVQMKQKETAVPPGAAATVLVIDTSASMNYCTKEEHQHTDACYQWEECTPQVNPDHYRWDGGHRILNTNCEYKDGRYIYPASQTCGKEGHTHTSDTC